jgi:hypothetical protein
MTCDRRCSGNFDHLFSPKINLLGKSFSLAKCKHSCVRNETNANAKKYWEIVSSVYSYASNALTEEEEKSMLCYSCATKKTSEPVPFLIYLCGMER